MKRLLGWMGAIAMLGCQGVSISGGTSRGSSTGVANPQGSGTAGGSSGAGTSAAGSSTGMAASSSSGATSNAGTTNGGSSSSGSSTGVPLPPIIDGGYVFCALGLGDGGTADWQCTPGTYFCAGPFNCLQCRSDADCANEGLPTFDARKPHCDLISGVSGYQNFCEQCLDDAQCSDPSRPFCDIDPSYPDGIFGAISTEPPIVSFGFETCSSLPVDCRDDGGEVCDGLNQTCSLDSGRCGPSTGPCKSDANCRGVFALSPYFPVAVLAPFCIDGACVPCAAGACPAEGCGGDQQCANPANPSLPGVCIPEIGECGCHNDQDCTGPKPVCRALDAGLVDADGGAVGVCTCDTTAECGDAGELCATGSTGINRFVIPTGFCTLPCDAPGLAPCRVVVGPNFPICDVDSGFCEPCSSDAQCRADPSLGGPFCDGACTCHSDSDCPTGQGCREISGGTRGCAPVFAGCTPSECPSQLCDWDSGGCAGSPTREGVQPCGNDYDCTINAFYNSPPKPFCDPQSGTCVACLDEEDCRRTGAGGRCLVDGGFFCRCSSAADCFPGQACNFGYCIETCGDDLDCASGYFCDPGFACRPRCDGNHTCQWEDRVCDSNDVVQQNGSGFSGADPGVVWCYACLGASDCDSGICSSVTHSCGACGADTDCPAGEFCGEPNGTCRSACDAGPCPVGSVCDALGVTNFGTNVCVGCLSPVDCPNGQGCNLSTGVCGACQITDINDRLASCPPGDICSNYWSGGSGVCLEDCDLRSCPADRPICAVFPPLTPDHNYCFGCLTDADCTSAGTNAWCDTSVNLTFTCQLPR